MDTIKTNPLERFERLGAMNPAIPDSIKGRMHVKVHYHVFNVNDPSENTSLCNVKAKIIRENLAYSEETTFDKSGNWLVALNWYEVEEATEDNV